MNVSGDSITENKRTTPTTFPNLCFPIPKGRLKMRNPEKSALRKQFRRARAQMSADERNAATETINRLLKPYIKKGRKIGVYWPMGKELRLDGFVRAAQKRGAKLYLPYIEPGRKRMWFTPYRANAQAERKRGRSRLHVPQFAGRKVRADRLDVMLLPVVAADRQGYRLGQNGGYYDATLARPFRTAAAHRRRLFLPAYRQPATRSTRYAAARFRVGTA